MSVRDAALDRFTWRRVRQVRVVPRTRATDPLSLAAVLHIVSIRQTTPLLRGVAPTLKRTS